MDLKYFLTAALLLYACLTYAQEQNSDLPIDAVTGKIAFTKVIEVPGATKAALYSTASNWLGTYFKPKKANEIIQVSDLAAGMVIGKHDITVAAYDILLSRLDYQFQYTISIYLKEGKFKYEISSLQLKSLYVSSSSLVAESYLEPGEKILVTNQVKNGKPHKVNRQIKEEVIKHLSPLIESLEASMKKAG